METKTRVAHLEVLLSVVLAILGVSIWLAAHQIAGAGTMDQIETDIRKCSGLVPNSTEAESLSEPQHTTSRGHPA